VFYKQTLVPLALCLALAPSTLAAAKPAAKPATKPAASLLVPKDGMVITKSARLRPGVYHLPKGIVIGADGVTLDGNGAVFVGNGSGQAVRSVKRNNVTVRNLHASKYRWGVRIEGAKNATVRDCHIRETAEVEPPDGVWLNIWAKPEEAYGAAVILFDVTGGLVTGNDVQHQQNGISLYGCTGVTVEKNNASFQSGWGIHLFNSSRNTVQDNLADWCNRIHKRGEGYYPGADAAGLLVIWNSSNNIFRRNMLRGGGDGVFVAGYHPESGKLPCNDNLFEENDGSYSPNNAFESTFCEGNIFRNNKANTSNYGFWLGYSWENKLEGNEVRGNRIAGIAIEHGHHNEIMGNRIFSNTRGIALWARANAAFLDRWPDSVTSAFYDIHDNTIFSNGVGLFSKMEAGGDRRRRRQENADQGPSASALAAARPHDYTIRANTFYGNEIGALLMDSDRLILQGNRFQANTDAGLRIEGGREVRATLNNFLEQPTHAWADVPVTWTEGSLKDGTPQGNYWSGAEGQSFKPSGPNPGTDTAPLAAPPAPMEGFFRTEREMLRDTPR